ncbi:solute symporter family protein [Effusibacillus dendaii]|uniref:Cation acetate symporter n=1 Tax=Effusibacillus dendaii TaxID=2743772 RepID=A0A7I8DAP2_9BACL|nr:cation acetate symporter [Effusibacillus dendaii]BCJ87258.1 cation acetate symporter [Effusibacillus dendaii]
MNTTAFSFFVGIILLTLLITYWAARRNKSTSEFYVAGGTITGWQNALAIAGDYMSAASFLGIAGAIALNGFSGFFYSIGYLVAYLVVLFIVAEPLRNLGKYTMADMIAARFDAKAIRSAAALNTLAISTFYMIAQLVGAGAIIKLLLGLDYSTSVIIIGILMTIYVVAGGMLATTWVQIVKAVLLMGGTIALSLMVLAHFSFNPVEMFNQVAAKIGDKAVTPPTPTTISAGLDSISLNLALVLGTAGLPHILIRFLSVPDAKTARKSIVIATWIIGLFYLMTPILGYGAAYFVGQDMIKKANAAGNLAAPQLAEYLGGNIFLAFISAVAFATILAVVAGLVISAASAFAHDFYSNVLRKGQATETEQMKAARWASFGIAVVSIILALGAKNFNVSYLVALAFCVAASANLPVIVFTIFWKRFNSAGAVTGMLTGLIGSVGLILLSPNVMPAADAIFPLKNPGIVSIPLGFLAAYLGTVLTGSATKQEEEKHTQIFVQANTGIKKLG